MYYQSQQCPNVGCKTQIADNSIRFTTWVSWDGAMHMLGFAIILVKLINDFQVWVPQIILSSVLDCPTFLFN